MPGLAADSRDGTVVRATGIARRLVGESAFVPPVAGVPCVVAWTRYGLHDPVQPAGNKPLVIERWQIKPFILDAPPLHVIVDAGHIELMLPSRSDGNLQEISVAEGQRITVIGTVLHDGIELPADEQAFRDMRVGCKLVGNRAHPVVITASVSDTLAG